MQLREYLDRAINDCERSISILDLQLKVDRGYIESTEADPTDVGQIRCQVELQLLEREFLDRKLALLKRWAGDLDTGHPRLDLP